ncbi:carbohydrate ABC transporter permease [Lentzea sp. HUAS12]|uniref:carbohydrate ABC transporter permease n=1 Tax=Lentzea sp. HUAS12 TaxID=2951806 RepID=UPI0020A0AA6D|nr:sugar ABC transporter permease [Lentzea sp. HUAS12]USX56256.1 sugar ABC transporter permease [Lentzea sp. HUAS12]
MSAPALIGLIGFLVVPLVLAVVLSLFSLRLNSARPAQFVGLDQYARILFDPDLGAQLRRALFNNATFAAVVVPLQTALALGLALLCNRKVRGMVVFRTVFFMPVVFPMALVAVVWRVIYSRDSAGLLNAGLNAVTSGNWSPHDWLGAPGTAMASVVLLSIWQGVGLQMVIILAGLQGIPDSLYEAAAVDGVTTWQKFRHITLPSLRPTLVFVVTVTTILSFRLFDQVYVLIRGGADEDSTRTVLYEAVTTAFDGDGNIGRASAITVVFFVIVLALTLVQRGLLGAERKKA